MLGRVILWLGLGYLIYTVVKAAWQAYHRPRHVPPPGKSRRGEAMERDPQCGTFVPRSDAFTATVRGKQQWFCSTRCRDEYSKKH